MFFLNNNGTSLAGIIDVTAHNISLFQENENEPPKNIIGISIPKRDISIAEPYDVQIDELGNSVITIYQFIGDINDAEVGGLESLLNYVNENSFSKAEPAINEHHHHIIKKQYNEEAHGIYIIDKATHLTLRIIGFQLNNIPITSKTLITVLLIT